MSSSSSRALNCNKLYIDMYNEVLFALIGLSDKKKLKGITDEMSFPFNPYYIVGSLVVGYIFFNVIGFIIVGTIFIVLWRKARKPVSLIILQLSTEEKQELSITVEQVLKLIHKNTDLIELFTSTETYDFYAVAILKKFLYDKKSIVVE